MILRNLHTSGNHTCDLAVVDGVLQAGEHTTGATELLFENAIAFPGLINSHDHLDYNLFPRLGGKIYEDYMAWGNDIHKQYGDTIRDVLNIPKELRVQWGLYKNLLNGVTTVVQHGERFSTDDNIISIFQEYHFLHSVQLEKHWKLRLNKPRKDDWPFVIHIGEGTNERSFSEINQLIKWNLLKKKLVGIHGVTMNTSQAKYFHALIWSPNTNLFLLGKTADVLQLKNVVPVIFGTDSTLTGHWSIWEQMRTAKNTGMADAAELYDMVTAKPAQVWNIPGAGSLKPGAAADMVIAEKNSTADFFDAFINTRPENILLVMHKGIIHLFDESIYGQLKDTIDAKSFSRIAVNGRIKYITGDVPSLMQRIRTYYPGIVFPDVSIV
ncbi:amidohydrolase family protein [Chitinophagaceae bacterium MMS25-I14]